MADQIITCPNCRNEIPLSEALRHQIEEQVLAQEKQKHAQEMKLLEVKIAQQVKHEIEEKTSIEMQDLQKQLNEKQHKVEEMQKYELQLREEKRQLEEGKKQLKLEVQRQLDEERKKIEEAVTKQILDEHRLKEAEKDKLINDLKIALEDAQRKATQSSQQRQGEVLELDLENTLRSAFLNDEISPVEKGIKGADVQQIVKSPKGYNCGVILWEFKNTKSWVDGWTVKLKEDVRNNKATVGVIVSMNLPKNSKCEMELRDGVWICSIELVTPLAILLRQGMLDVAFQRAVSLNRANKAEQLYDYVTGLEFSQQVEAIAQVSKEMREQLAKERIAFEKIWKSRETQIFRLACSTAGLYGSMQGLIGSSLPQIPNLELESDERS